MKFIFVLILSLFSLPGLTAVGAPAGPDDIGIREHLGEKISTDLIFTNSNGESVTLGSLLNPGLPTILNFVYYECPNLCQFFLQGFKDSLKEFEWDLGKKFQIITVSIDPSEGAALANQKKESLLKAYGRKVDPNAWHFLTGSAEAVRKLADEAGFHYRYDEKLRQYLHASAIFILSPEGKIARTLYGVQFEPWDLKLALLEASEGKGGNFIDRFVSFCYRYDPQSRRYVRGF